MARKTMSVAKLLKMANAYLENPKSSREGRAAIDAFISNILHETGNYRGFAIKEGADVPVYSDDAPYRHSYFLSEKIVDEYHNLSN